VDQPTSRLYIFAPWIQDRHRVVCRERDDLVASGVEERIGGDHERAHLLLGDRYEGCLDLVFSAGPEKTKLIAPALGNAHQVLDVEVCSNGPRVDQNAGGLNFRSPLREHLQLLW